MAQSTDGVGYHEVGAESIVTALAGATHTSAIVVQAMYTEELATLHAQARIKSFVPIIAVRRVRDRLRAQY